MSTSRPLTSTALLLLVACNRYEHFNVAGYEQASFDNEADILFVIDNSPSMAEETASLALNFNVFINTLTSTEDGAEQVTDTLSDAVGNYVDYTQQRGRFLDYNLAITTTSVDYSNGETDGIDPGEAGTFLGTPTVLSKGDLGVDEAFTANLLCEAAYWSSSSVPSSGPAARGPGLRSAQAAALRVETAAARAPSTERLGEGQGASGLRGAGGVMAIGCASCCGARRGCSTDLATRDVWPPTYMREGVNDT